jgi:hypothetical protein
VTSVWTRSRAGQASKKECSTPRERCGARRCDVRLCVTIHQKSLS